MNIMIYIFIGIITFGILYCGYWMYIKLSTADTRLLQLVNEINRVKTDLRASKNELSSAINANGRFVVSRVTSESQSVKQLLKDQLQFRANELNKSIEFSREGIEKLICIVNDFQNQANIKLKKNANRMDDLEKSVTSNITSSLGRMQTLVTSSMQQLNSNTVKFNNDLEKHLNQMEKSNGQHFSRFDASITSLTKTIQHHTETISSSCEWMVERDRELHKATTSRFEQLNSNFSAYLRQLKEFDKLLNNFQIIYKKIQEEEEKINKQETSLVGMVDRHAQIFEMTAEMNKTSKEIFEFMKLYLIRSTFDTLKTK